MFAGLGLASLYLTVLGFHHITIGKILIITNNKLELDTLFQWIAHVLLKLITNIKSMSQSKVYFYLY